MTSDKSQHTSSWLRMLHNSMTENEAGNSARRPNTLKLNHFQIDLHEYVRNTKRQTPEQKSIVENESAMSKLKRFEKPKPIENDV